MDYNEFATKVKAKYPQYGDMDNRELATKMVAKYPEYKDVTFDSKTPYQDIWKNPNQSIPQKAWQSLAVPEQTAKKLLGGLASQIPEGKITGNMPMDIARGTPRILANTVAQAAPGFVSRPAILTAGAVPLAKGLVKGAAPALRWAGETGEEWAGLKPGTLESAYKDPTLMFSRGKKAASPYYQTVQKEIEGSSLLNNTPSNLRLVNNADKMAQAGRLSEGEALEARKAADALKSNKGINKNWLAQKRKAFDAIAKKSTDISQGDIAYKRGALAQDLRSVFPKNVGGRSSPFKVGEGMVLAKHLGPLGKVLGMMMSPMVQGGAATGLGAAMKMSPQTGILIQQLLQRMTGNNANPNPQ